ncbi:MBL fold metallo-hydrolase [Paenibacillus sp. 481]|uniref:MBL fold metallo-hydrolase n=1 Tax=Paenibacillus sp. 481 TaxID=2835869 RepID=UPI001E29329A|nr:MBL fold metallo-hydrolase [Paenibacillus sp. 481]UHA74086.1 MBL fold metallo-hydrolase [Paenibacillus sp. 481]
MALQLQMLGTGSAFAKSYYNNNALLHTDSTTLLIDCGITAPMALHHIGKTFNEIDGFLISHIHADHVGGLEEAAFQFRFRYKRKPNLYIAAPLVDLLWEHTLKGGLSQEEITALDDVFHVHPLQPDHTYELTPDIRVKLLETPHMPGKQSFSILLNERIFYSADMRFQPDLLRVLVEEQGVELIFHDCQLIGPGEVHTTLDELLTLPESIQQRILLMHYSDEMPQYEGRTGKMRFIHQHKQMSLDGCLPFSI